LIQRSLLFESISMILMNIYFLPPQLLFPTTLLLKDFLLGIGICVHVNFTKRQTKRYAFTI